MDLYVLRYIQGMFLFLFNILEGFLIFIFILILVFIFVFVLRIKKVLEIWDQSEVHGSEMANYEFISFTYRWVKTNNGQAFADSVGVKEPPMSLEESVSGVMRQVC